MSTNKKQLCTSILDLRNSEHPFFEWLNQELPHLLYDEDDCFSGWFEQYRDYEDKHEEDMLSSLHDWIPYCMAEKIVEYGFNLNKYGYFNFSLITTPK